MRNLVRATLLSGALLTAFASQAQAAITIGETFDPTGGICTPGNETYLQIAPSQYAAPTEGVITSWSHQAGAFAHPQLKLKVARSVLGSFFIVGESAFQPIAPNTLNTFPTQISVLAGDVIGLALGGEGDCYRPVNQSFQYVGFDGDPAPGTTVSSGGSSDLFQFDISAQLEPVDTDPPQTKITKGAPNETDASKVKFKFRSDEAGSTFKCKLDKKSFKSCKSPKTVKRLNDGKHKFQVRAIDPAGNSDPTAAKDKFKVVD